MPFRHFMQPEKQTATVIAEGIIDAKTSVQAMMNLVADPNFVPTYNVVVDLRNMDYQPDVQALFTISDRLSILKGKFQGGIQLIVPNKYLYLARLACILTSSAGVKMEATAEEN